MSVFGDTVFNPIKCFQRRILWFIATGSWRGEWEGGMFRLSLFSLLVSHPHFAMPDPSKPGDVSFPREYGPPRGWPLARRRFDERVRFDECELSYPAQCLRCEAGTGHNFFHFPGPFTNPLPIFTLPIFY